MAQQLAKATQYVVALDSQDHVLGVLAISRPHITEELIQQLNWHDKSCIHPILSDRHRYIHTSGIHNHYQGKGIAQQLNRLRHQQFSGAYFSAFVVTQPVLNPRSLAFHDKQGFQDVGTFAHDTFLNFQNDARACWFWLNPNRVDPEYLGRSPPVFQFMQLIPPILPPQSSRQS